VTTSTGPAAQSQPAVGGAIVGHEDIDQWGHKAVAAHGPIPERPPIKPQDRSAPSRAFQSGDLECRSCGEANLPELKFCRRCGRNLADAKVVGPSKWQKLRSLLESEKEPPV
jgi:ribosomal protein S14